MHEEKKTKEYFEKLKGIRMSDSSRARISEHLREYARFHGSKEGVRVGQESRSIGQVPKHSYTGTSFISRLYRFKITNMTAIVLIALLVGGGTSYAAQGSVPGDALYSVKVGVNENIRSAFAISNAAEAALQAQLAEERLEEAEKLAARGELDANAAADLSARLRTHYQDAERRSDEAESQGDYESSATVRASLEGSFRTYARVLTDLNARVSGNNGASLISDVETYADAAAKSQATATVDVSVDAKGDIEATIKRADRILAEVETKLTRAQASLSAEAYARIKTQFDAAVTAQAEAKAHLRAELYREAYTAVQAAIRITQEVETMINSALRLKVDVRVDTDGVLDGAVDVRTDTDTRGETEMESDSAGDDKKEMDDTTETDAERGTGVGADVEVDIRTDTSVDTDAVDTQVETDTSVRGSSGLSL